MRKYSDGGTTDYSHYVTAVAALFNQQGDILILQRGSTAPWMPNAWSLVGGVVDEGENPDEAIVREIMEETGLQVLNLQYKQTKYTKDAGKIVYYVGMLPANFIVRLDYENQDFAFVNLSNIDKYKYVPHVKAFMRNLLEPPTQMSYHKKPKLAEGGIVKKYGFTEAEIDKWEKENKVSQRKTQNPVVKEAITEMAEGKLTQDEYLKILQKNNPIKPFDRVPPLPTLKEIVGSLKTNQLEKQGIIGYTVEIPDGAYVASRLDIPAYDNYDVWVVSVHDGNKEKNVIGYGKTAYLKNVTFKSSPKTAMRIGMGLSSKSTFARMYGTWVNKSPEVVRNMAVRYMNNPNWIQVGMNPYRHSWFYDKVDGLPLVSAEEVIQVGALVLAKNAVKTTVDDPEFIVDKKNPAIKYSDGGKTGSVYYRATSEDMGKQTVFTPVNKYEAFDDEGNPLTRGASDVFVLSDIPEISASKTIGGAILGLWSMFNHNGINPVGKKIYIYEIMDRPRKDLSHVRMADFEYLKEVRYDKPVNGVRSGYFVFDTEFNNNALNFYERLNDDDPYSEIQYDEDAWYEFEKYILTLNNNDIVKYADGGELVTLKKAAFIELPKKYQIGILIRAYEVNEDVDWSINKSITDWVNDKDVNTLIKDYAKHYPNRIFAFGLLPVKYLISKIEKTSVLDDYNNFNEYHKNYSYSNYAKHENAEIPILIDDREDEFIEDGWHRFHRYIDMGMVNIPVVSYNPNIEITNHFSHGGLVAPNGKPSNLTHEQWHLVRTPEFKAWFGDWENNPETASKVVDSNGEPLVVWHSSPNYFNIFDAKKTVKGLFHFGTIQQAINRLTYYIETVGFDLSPYIKLTTEQDEEMFEIDIYWELVNYILLLNFYKKNDVDVYFDNIFNSKQKEFLKKIKINIDKNKIKSELDKYNIKPYFLRVIKLGKTNDVGENWELDSSLYDGYVYVNIHEGNKIDNSYTVFYPNQIKLADGSNTTFDGNNPDIRYADGGKMNEGMNIEGEYSSLRNFIDFNPNYIKNLIEIYGIKESEVEESLDGELGYDEEVLNSLLGSDYRIFYNEENDEFEITKRRKGSSASAKIVLSNSNNANQILEAINKEILTEYEPRFGVMYNGKIVGGSTYHINNETYYFDIALSGKARGLGISKMLISNIIEDAKKMGVEKLEAEVVNPYLLDYLESIGFSAYKNQDQNIAIYHIENSNDMQYKKGGKINIDDYMLVTYHEKTGNWAISKNEIYLWLYDDMDAGNKLQSGEFDYVLFPPRPPIQMAFKKNYVPPLLQVWTKKYQNRLKGSEKLMAIIRAWYDETNHKLYILMMTTRKDLRKRGIISSMIKELRKKFNIEQEDVIFDDPTEEGKAVMESKKFDKGGKTETSRPYSNLDISRVKKGVVQLNSVHPKRITKIDDLPI